MKKFIIAALAVLLGSWGYTIVDATLEQRVTDLESKLFSLEEVVESYHGVLETVITTTKKPVATTTRPGTTASTTVIGEIPGYRYDFAGDFYYVDDKDCWQKNCSYNEVYDNIAPMAAMFVDQLRVNLRYDDKDWLIQLRKGQFGYLFVGAETGIFTAPLGSFTGNPTDITKFHCADKEDWLYMQLDCYWSENNTGSYKKVFTREYDKYWWATGFVKGALTKYTWPRTELKALNRITFKSEEMASLFVLELKKAGFVRASAANKLVDDSYFQNGNDVYLLWATIYHDALAQTTTTAAPTTATTKAPTTTQAPTTATTKAPTTY